MDLDKLEEIAEEHGEVSRRGLYTGMVLGRGLGGYAGMETGKSLLPGADIADIYPQIDPGHLGPEESAVYALVVTGYFLGGIGTAKAITRYQEWKGGDPDYTKPFLTPIGGLRKAKEYLEGEEEMEEVLEEE